MKYIIPIIIGGIIGYFTNWLAMKMLFRPLNAKYIFGYKLPFTPGLIPKEKDRIARSIGLTIEDYLLSPESIMKSIDREELRAYLRDQVDRSLAYIDREEPSLEDLLGLLNKEDKWEEDLAQTTANYLIDRGELDPILEALADLVTREENKKWLGQVLETKLDDYLEGQSLREDMAGLYAGALVYLEGEERSLRELMPGDLEKLIFRTLDENYRLIAFKLRQVLASPEVETRIRSSIRQLLSKNLTGLLASLLPVDMVGDKVYAYMEGYIKSDEAAEDIKRILTSLADKILDKEVRDINKDFVRVMDREAGLDLASSLAQNTSLRKGLSRGLEEILARLDLDSYREDLDQGLRAYIRTDEFRGQVAGLILKLGHRVKKVKLGQVLRASRLERQDLYRLGESLFQGFIKERIPALIKQLKLSKIVERTIHEFDNEFIEKLILDIAEKELKAITILGGVLGGFIGVLTPLIQLLY